MEDKYCINGKMYFSAPYVDKLQAELKEKLEHRIKTLESELTIYKKENLAIAEQTDRLLDRIKYLEHEIDNWRSQFEVDRARIKELKKANNELASAAISKDEVLCEFEPYETCVRGERFIKSIDLKGNGVTVSFKSRDYVHQPYAKIKVVREAI